MMIKQASDLFKVSNSVLVIDLCDAVSRVDINSIKGSITSHLNGIYFKDDISPIIQDGGDYYWKDGDNWYLFESLEEILTKGMSIYTLGKQSGYELLLSNKYFNMMSKHIHIGPTYTSIIARIAIIILLRYVESLCSYSRFGSYGLYIGNELTNDVLETIEDGVIRTTDTLFNFIDNDYWNIYFCKVKDNLLIIEKSVDFRIYDWHRQRDLYAE